MTHDAIRSLSLVILLGLALSGCRQMEIPVKPTPTAAPAAAAGGAAGAATSGSVALAGRIVTQGRVVPARSVTLSFANGGIVAQTPAGLGEPVAAGQVLAQLDTAALELQLAQAEANLAAAQARLAQLDAGPAEQDVAAARQNVASAQATYDRLAAGPAAPEVAAAQAALAAAQQSYAQVRAGPGADELAQLDAQVANARALLEQAQAAYDKVKGNPEIAMLPQSAALQQATNNYNAAAAAYKAAAGHPTAAELAAAAAQVQLAQASLDRLTPDASAIQAGLAALENAKAQLAQLERPPSAEERAVLEASLAAARASRDLAAGQLQSATLVAPFAGVVMKLDIAAGEYAAPGAAVLLLADTSAWQIETTDLTELNIAQVSEGLPARVTFEAIPGLELAGRVGVIEPYGESHQGDIVYTVNILLDEQDPRLRWNMTAKIGIEPR